MEYDNLKRMRLSNTFMHLVFPVFLGLGSDIQALGRPTMHSEPATVLVGTSGSVID